MLTNRAFFLKKNKKQNSLGAESQRKTVQCVVTLLLRFDAFHSLVAHLASYKGYAVGHPFLIAFHLCNGSVSLTDFVNESCDRRTNIGQTSSSGMYTSG